MLEFEKQQQLRELRESGMWNAEMEAKINELFGLKAAAISAVEEKTPTSSGGRESFAVLDATFASQQFGGRSKEIDLLGKIVDNTNPRNRANGIRGV